MFILTISTFPFRRSLTLTRSLQLSTCILDPRLHTPEKTLYRSSFLFTVVCAIASRYHPSRTTLYPILMNFARLAAGTAIISGRKSLEACQAYILLSQYPMPARRWSEDRSWMYLGCAIRMATDLNLHHPPVLEGGEPAVTISTIMETEWQSREILNRTRCWLGCFNADKAMSTQFGKPTTLREGVYRLHPFLSSSFVLVCALTNDDVRLDVPPPPAQHLRFGRRSRMVVSHSLRMEIRYSSLCLFGTVKRDIGFS